MATRLFPVERGFVPTSPFGRRINPVTGVPEGHLGQDFGHPAGSEGRKIYAAQSGTVVYIGNASGFGQWIVLDHSTEEGSGTTVYGHMWDAFATGLRAGSHVDAGQHIAFVGSNGQSTAPHLHFEVHPTVWKAGSQIDPVPWLANCAYPGDLPAGPPPPTEADLWAAIRFQETGQ